MGKSRDLRGAEVLEEDCNPTIGNPDYQLDDEAFFDKYEPKHSRLRRKKACNARRKLEEYREAQELKDMLADFYDD